MRVVTKGSKDGYAAFYKRVEESTRIDTKHLPTHFGQRAKLVEFEKVTILLGSTFERLRNENPSLVKELEKTTTEFYPRSNQKFAVSLHNGKTETLTGEELRAYAKKNAESIKMIEPCEQWLETQKAKDHLLALEKTRLVELKHLVVNRIPNLPLKYQDDVVNLLRSGV